MRYTIFETRWGWFGLADSGAGVCRTCLPTPNRDLVQQALLTGLDDASCDAGLLTELQQRIVAYFEGENVDFSTDPAVDLADRSAFDRAALTACRRIGPGQTITYGELAVKIGRPGAARAVGNVMARNPVPLIVPCHRVLCSSGALGGFSAPGGTATKQRMLQLEQTPRRKLPEADGASQGRLLPTG
jgi:methylated-DNA-[protein]-cysteine S-methyltransferase